MKTHVSYIAAAALAASSLLVPGSQQTAHAADAAEDRANTPAPIVFQAAGPSAASIQAWWTRSAPPSAATTTATSLVRSSRDAAKSTGTAAGSTATSLVPTPFDGFLVTRGAASRPLAAGSCRRPRRARRRRSTTPPTHDDFQCIQPGRGCSQPIDSTVTDGTFFVPGGRGRAGDDRGFGAVFADVDQLGA